MSQGPVSAVVDPLELELLDVLDVLDPLVEPDPLEELELPAFCSTMVPAVVGLAGCGVSVSVLPETQYGYLPSEVVIALLADVSVPLLDALMDTMPMPPVC
jgi:hypothetical protein